MIADDLVECFGDMHKLRNVQIVTNAYTEAIAPPVDYRWLDFPIAHGHNAHSMYD